MVMFFLPLCGLSFCTFLKCYCGISSSWCWPLCSLPFGTWYIYFKPHNIHSIQKLTTSVNIKECQLLNYLAITALSVLIHCAFSKGVAKRCTSSCNNHKLLCYCGIILVFTNHRKCHYPENILGITWTNWGFPRDLRSCTSPRILSLTSSFFSLYGEEDVELDWASENSRSSGSRNSLQIDTG